MKLQDALIMCAPFWCLNLVIAVIPAYFLWNWIVPDIFSLPEIGFFQMLGLIVLINCLLGRGFISLDTST